MHIHAARVPIEGKQWLARGGSLLGIVTDTWARIIVRLAHSASISQSLTGWLQPSTSLDAARAQPSTNQNVTAFQLLKNPPVVASGHRYRKTPIAGPNNKPLHTDLLPTFQNRLNHVPTKITNPNSPTMPVSESHWI